MNPEFSVVENNDPDTLFAEFWNVCPKKVGKLLTIRKWNDIIGPGLETRALDETTGIYVEYKGDNALRATPDQLIHAMKEYRKTQIEDYGNTPFKDMDAGKYTLVEGGKFTLHPATFLNKGRFMDYL